MIDNGEIIGVIVGGLLTLLSSVLIQFLEQRKQKQKADLDNQKLEIKNKLKYEMGQRKKIEELKTQNINSLRNYNQAKNKKEFNGLDFSEAQLSGLNLRKVHLVGAILNKVEMRHCCLAKSEMQGSICKGANFEGTDFQNAHLENADFSRANLRNTQLLGAYMDGLILIGADLTGSQFTKDSLSKAIFK